LGARPRRGFSPAASANLQSKKNLKIQNGTLFNHNQKRLVIFEIEEFLGLSEFIPKTQNVEYQRSGLLSGQ